MKNLIFGLFVLGLTTQVFSQVNVLSEVEITAVNYKYLDAVDTEDTAINIKKLEEAVALYDLKNSELYVDEYYTYNVSFYIPEGKIVAAYDKNGNMLRTIEKFKNVKLPKEVLDAVTKRFPNWFIVKDAYMVNYHSDKGVTKKQYKIDLINGEKNISVKTDEKGNFL